jgi:hypothetical protein
LTDATVGYLVIGIAIVFVLGLVFALSSREGRLQQARPTPPPGVHLPSGSFLPVVLAIGAALLGAGFAFRPQGAIANLFLAVPGLVVLIGSIFAWVRAAGREWREIERAAHDDAAGH